MRVRWMPIMLVTSVLGNFALGAGWLLTLLDWGHWQSDLDSSFRYLREERAELRAMRGHFCGEGATADRDAILAWHAGREREAIGEPFEKDGLLWLDFVGARFAVDGRLVGVCLPQTWSLLDEPGAYPEERTGELCPLERLC